MRVPRALAAVLVASALLGGSLAVDRAEHEGSTAGVVRPDAIRVPRFSKVAGAFQNHGYRQVTSIPRRLRS